MDATDSKELVRQAANLAFAMLRFGDGAAHLPLGVPTPGAPRLGVDHFMFIPSHRFVARTDVVEFLASLESPAVLANSTTRGAYSLHLLDELRGDRERAARSALSSAESFIEANRAQLSLDRSSQVILQFDDDELFVSFDTLLTCARRFAVNVAANMRPYTDDGRAHARLMLYRADHVQSWGGWCPIPARDSPTE